MLADQRIRSGSVPAAAAVATATADIARARVPVRTAGAEVDRPVLELAGALWRIEEAGLAGVGIDDVLLERRCSS
jgi:hypothetical protein